MKELNELIKASGFKGVWYYETVPIVMEYEYSYVYGIYVNKVRVVTLAKTDYGRKEAEVALTYKGGKMRKFNLPGDWNKFNEFLQTALKEGPAFQSAPKAPKKPAPPLTDEQKRTRKIRQWIQQLTVGALPRNLTEMSIYRTKHKIEMDNVINGNFSYIYFTEKGGTSEDFYQGRANVTDIGETLDTFEAWCITNGMSRYRPRRIKYTPSIYD